MNNQVNVACILPFWRYAVGPTSQSVPAIPFFRQKSAREFFEYAIKELPFSGCCLYKRRIGGLVKIEEYVPLDPCLT